MWGKAWVRKEVGVDERGIATRERMPRLERRSQVERCGQASAHPVAHLHSLNAATVTHSPPNSGTILSASGARLMSSPMGQLVKANCRW